MKHISILMAGVTGLLATAAAGCRNTGSPYQPGPVAGQTVGGAAGVVGGNAVGFGKGVVGGTVAGYSSVMDPSYHMVRYWRTEVTSDGRTIQVPYDILVDQYGRPSKMPSPTRNPNPPPTYLPSPVMTNAPVN